MKFFYVPADCEQAVRDVILSLPPEQRPERWVDGSYCRQDQTELVWPLEGHGRNGRETPRLRLFLEEGNVVWGGVGRPVLRVFMDPVTGGWTREEYSLPREWRDALRQALPHFESN